MGPLKKRRQHHVWQYYLRAWTDERNDQLWCKHEQRTFPTTPRNVAVEGDFYRLRELSPEDLKVIEAFCQRMPPQVRKRSLDVIPMFTTVFELRKLLQQSSGPSDERQHIEQQLDALITNIEEDLHGAIEERSQPLLEALRSESDAWLRDDDSCAKLIHFLHTQYFRTKAMEQSVKVALSDLPLPCNMDAVWPVLRTIFASSSGWSVFSQRENLSVTFARVPDGIEFITGDQPVVNLRATSEGPPKELELYYPLNPSLAFISYVGPGPGQTIRTTVSHDQVEAWNRRIESAAHSQVFASSREALLALNPVET